MNKQTKQQVQAAIRASKNADWENAVAINQEIIDQNPQDIAALNRKGVALLQLGKKSEAKKTFQLVLEIEKTNKIAQKFLDKIKKKQNILAPSFSSQQFIEEPGKTKTMQLHRLAGKKTLEQLHIGEEAVLKPKSRYISVEVQGNYVGSLPEDLSFRLTRLMKSGNEFRCWVQSVQDNQCSVFIKETFRSKKNKNTSSFCISTANTLASSFDDPMVSQENLPVVIVSTDEEDDKPKNLSDIRESIEEQAKNN